MTKLFTKTGDKGSTSLGGNIRVEKTDVRIEANGCIDELNALLGYTKTQAPKPIANILSKIQTNLMDIMAAVAGKDIDTTPLIAATSTYEAEMSKEECAFEFTIPGSSALNGLFHILRTKVRTCERRLWQANAISQLPKDIMTYMNRLSDYLFFISRKV